MNITIAPVEASVIPPAIEADEYHAKNFQEGRNAKGVPVPRNETG
jgi:hypothetical protein